MSRPKRIRKVTNPPHYKGFKPIGMDSDMPPVVLNYEEYESIRLNDFAMLGHVEAAKVMGVSRPTYSRIYESARQKVAMAFVNGQPIVFEGGKVYFDSDWYKCNTCGCYFNHLEKGREPERCALCSSPGITSFDKNQEVSRIEDIYICPACGREHTHSHDAGCRHEKCPDCQCPMVRKGILNNESATI